MMERAHASTKTIFFVNILNFTLDFFFRRAHVEGKTHRLALRVAGFSLCVNSFKDQEYNGNINAYSRTVDCRFFATREFFQR